VKPKVKICCISSIEEAKLAIAFGANAIGLVSEMPSGPGVISEELIIQIANSVPPTIHTFLLTSKQDVKSIIQQAKRCKINTVQIVDDLTEGNHSDLKKGLPETQIVQVLHIQDERSIEDAINISSDVDAILLDSGNQMLNIKKLGGTGKTHDWSISKKIVELVQIPIYLAGGINSTNVLDAIYTVGPYGLDLCSSVRTNNKLDPTKLKDFFVTLNTI